MEEEDDYDLDDELEQALAGNDSNGQQGGSSWSSETLDNRLYAPGEYSTAKIRNRRSCAIEKKRAAP